jgi:hypothetical protein
VCGGAYAHDAEEEETLLPFHRQTPAFLEVQALQAHYLPQKQEALAVHPAPEQSLLVGLLLLMVMHSILQSWVWEI